MPTSTRQLALFPSLLAEHVLAFQFSSWYPAFSHLTIRSIIIRPLPREFRQYLNEDSVFVPEGSEDVPAESTLSDTDSSAGGSNDGSATSDDQSPRYAFPELDAGIRQAVAQFGAVFPKLNFSSPRDASWILPASSPLKCTSPSEVYLLLKSSDFVSHDLDPVSVFAGCPDTTGSDYEIELVLRKWYPVDRSRELRCFIRDNILLGVSQRDNNYYDFLNEVATQQKVLSTVKQYWVTHVQEHWEKVGNYTFDILLTRNLERAHVIDFNPYAPRTDSLLFTYEELLALYSSPQETVPQLRVIDSRSHPAAIRNAPAHQHNMIPFEALSLSSGADIEEFAQRWQHEVQKAAQHGEGEQVQ